jgi:hypothetical protein
VEKESPEYSLGQRIVVKSGELSPGPGAYETVEKKVKAPKIGS